MFSPPFLCCCFVKLRDGVPALLLLMHKLLDASLWEMGYTRGMRGRCSYSTVQKTHSAIFVAHGGLSRCLSGLQDSTLERLTQMLPQLLAASSASLLGGRLQVRGHRKAWKAAKALRWRAHLCRRQVSPRKLLSLPRKLTPPQKVPRLSVWELYQISQTRSDPPLKALIAGVMPPIYNLRLSRLLSAWAPRSRHEK